MTEIGSIDREEAKALCEAPLRTRGVITTGAQTLSIPVKPWKWKFLKRLYSADKLDVVSAFEIKHPHIPNALYKYRSFSCSHIKALSAGQLWCVSPETFNDPYDTTAYFDRWRTNKKIKPEWIEEYEHKRELLRQSLGSGTLPPDKADIVQDWLQRLSARDEEALKKAQFLRKEFRVLSLCENATSVLMWSHYSQNHTGFCIEYNLAALPLSDKRCTCCYPVFYRRKVFDATRYLAKGDIADKNNFFLISMCLVKSDEWAYEKEWRIVYPSGPVGPMDMAKPTSIILGKNVTPEDEEWMRAFCGERVIPLRRVVQRRDQFRLEIRDIAPY